MGGCVFVLEDVVAILKLVKVGLISTFTISVQTTKLWRLIAICAGFSATLIFLSSLVLKILRGFSAWLGDISVNAASDWYQFIGYVCNFDLLYLIFSIYAFSFLTACTTLLSLYFMSFVFGVFPEAVNIVKKILDSLTGD